MQEVRIFRPAKTAMQSGRAKTKQWMLEFAPGAREEPDPLMGWAGSPDTRNQVRMLFDTKDEAIAFAERAGYGYTVTDDAPPRRLKPKSYSDNFRFDRVE
jgi:hypothetical protein